MSIGLLPYSKVGYDFGRDILSDEISYRETFSGSGGLSKIYGGLAYAPIKYVSLGANVSYLFGSIKHTSDIPVLGNAGALSTLRNNSFAIKNVMFDLGAQFMYPINNNESVTLGVVFTPGVKNTTTIYETKMQYSGVGNNILPADTLYDQAFDLPATLGAGLSYNSTNWLVGIDGSLQKWSKMKYPDALDNMTLSTRFNDKYSVNLGAEYVADPVNRNFFKRVRLRGGLSYANSYINSKVYDPTNGNNLGTFGYKEYGVNVGFGFPFRDMISGRISMVNLGLGYSIMDPDNKFMIKEEMFKVSVNININEFWFFKRQFD